MIPKLKWCLQTNQRKPNNAVNRSRRKRGFEIIVFSGYPVTAAFSHPQALRMRFSRILSMILAAIAITIAVSPSACSQDGAKTVLVHYMPWYASKPVSGEWGWHWTMNRFNPETVKLMDNARSPRTIRQ